MQMLVSGWDSIEVIEDGGEADFKNSLGKRKSQFVLITNLTNFY